MTKEIIVTHSADKVSISLLKARTQKEERVIIVGPGGSSEYCSDLDSAKITTAILSEALGAPAMFLEEHFGNNSLKETSFELLWKFLSNPEVFFYFDIVIVVTPRSEALFLDRGTDAFYQAMINGQIFIKDVDNDISDIVYIELRERYNTFATQVEKPKEVPTEKTLKLPRIATRLTRTG